MSRRAPRSPHHHHLPLAALLMVVQAIAGCRAAPEHLSYDDDGVAHDVLALIPFNTKWAQGRIRDAVLYRIELRTDAAGERPPTDVLYSFYAPRRIAVLTATSDPEVPWAGAEPLELPDGRPVPMPLPPVKIDFREAWRLARAAGITRVTSAVLEVNQRNAMPIVAWSFTGQMADIRERGVYLDALTGARLYPHTLFDPPTTIGQVEAAISTYRGALRGDAAQDPRCPPHAVAVPSRRPVTCFDADRRTYTDYKRQG
ncbi:MAG: hypothetical protein IT355_05740 [Gemmatimonadaceae bacterium]|nr:hypothetical protein [Gemmatimonadaceae bacterium]